MPHLNVVHFEKKLAENKYLELKCITYDHDHCHHPPHNHDDDDDRRRLLQQQQQQQR